MIITGEPDKDFLRYDIEQTQRQDELENILPKCSCCGNTIWEDMAICYEEQWCCSGCEEIFWLNIRGDFLEKTMTW